MFLIAVTVWVGAGRWGGRFWNALALCAHLVPLTIIFIAAGVFDSTGSQSFAQLGLAIHLPLIALEAYALPWKASWLRRGGEARLSTQS